MKHLFQILHTGDLCHMDFLTVDQTDQDICHVYDFCIDIVGFFVFFF